MRPSASCVQALMGDFDPAVAIEKEVASLTTDHTFASRLAKLDTHQDCTGEE